jgi:MOSC domain-containing protein
VEAYPIRMKEGVRPREGGHVGTVISVTRYPVKSMMGEEVDSSFVTGRGLLGDRAFALLDLTTGKVVSAKNPRKWGKLFGFRASFLEAPQVGAKLPDVRVGLPDGSAVTTDQMGSDDILSRALGAQVKLTSSSPENPRYEEYWPDVEGRPRRSVVTEEAMPSHTFFDAATIHLLTTATTDRLHELYPQGKFSPRRFRPNIVVEPPPGADGFVEETWVDSTLRIGAEVRLRVTGPCTRCVMTTLAQGDLPEDLGILRTAALHNHAGVGVYASVEKEGTVRRKDAVWLD